MNSGEPDPANDPVEDSREKWITIDRLCDAYEASLQEGRAERAPFLVGVPPSWRDQLTQELDAIDAAYRDAKETREQTVTASPGEVGSRRLPKQSRLAELATLDSDKVWLGRFEIRKRLGTGATGSVWCARDARLARWVALKVPHATRVMSETSAARFQTEARAAAAISHPNVVQVHEVLIEDGLPILIQQWIDGPSLAQYLKEHGPIEFELAADWMAQVSDAVAAAHDCGIVHRDLKPANVMLDKNRPMVLDFGLASYPQLSSGLTSEGTLLGTPAYMSPEQADGGEDANKPTTDIYAIGVILYEMLTGAPPFVGKTREVLQASRNTIPVSPRSRRAGVPRDLETITLRCLAKNPAARYRTAAELRDDLQRFRRREPIRARKVSPLENILVWARLHPVASLLWTMVPLILMLAMFLVVSRSQQSRLVDKLIEESDENRELVSERYMVQLARASQELSGGDRSRGLALLRDIPPQARRWEWELLDMMSHSPAEAILDGERYKDFGAAINALELSLAGKSLFAATEDGKVLRWKLPDTKRLFSKNPRQRPRFERPEVMIDDTVRTTDLAVSVDGHWLASCDSDGRVRIWDLTENELAQTIEQTGLNNAYAVAFSPDGKQLVIGGGAKKTANRVADMAGWLSRFRLSDDRRFVQADRQRWDRPAVTSLVFTRPDEFYCTRGRPVATGQLLDFSDAGLVQRWTITEDRMRPEKVVWRGGAMNGLDFHAPSNRIAWSGEDGVVFVRSLDNDTAKSMCHFRAGTVPITQVRFAPSGQELAVTNVNGGVSRWKIGLPVPIDRPTQPNADPKQAETQPIAESSDGAIETAKTSDGQATSTEPPSRSQPMEDVRHVKDYFGHEAAVRDLVYLPPPMLKPREEKSYYPLAYLITAADDGDVLKWGHEDHQCIATTEVPNHGLYDAKWLSNDRLVMLSNNHRKSFLPSYQPRSLGTIGIDHRTIKHARKLSLLPSDEALTLETILSDAPNAPFAAMCSERIFILQPGNAKPLHQFDAPVVPKAKTTFTALALIDQRFLIAATARVFRVTRATATELVVRERHAHLWLYDLQHPKSIKQLKLPGREYVSSLVHSRDHSLLLIGTARGGILTLPFDPVIAATADRTVKRSNESSNTTTDMPVIEEVSDGAVGTGFSNLEPNRIPGHRGGVLEMVLLDRDRLASVGRDGICRIWSLPTLAKMIAAGESDASTKQTGPAPELVQVSESPATQTVAPPEAATQGPAASDKAATHNSGAGKAAKVGAVQGNASDSDERAVVAKLMVSTLPVTEIAVNTDGTRIATVDEAHVIRVWDTRSGLELVSIGPRKANVISIEFSPDSEKLLIAEPTGVVNVIWLHGKPQVAAAN
ncbi:WD40 repeat domain-containing serine/threonine protein kinase [Roseiconus lacunae]|uniref:WD40 repeat domain-containing serine/threonine protein kinase n=1 Tax=Roseiconus lacunae TaxID=2605694 RepID=UPI001E4732B4|nr:serine/threonine-protein kinase [Roseiconus lacunae]MCD0463221.1 serine/threonine-protein kinase [Roseiconus lacunae]